MSNTIEEPPQVEEPRKPKARKGLIITILVLTTVSILQRVINASDYATTSVMYIGLPALLAIGLSFVPTPRSVTGSILLWSTIFLLMIGILMVEGVVCILFILPFFLAIGFLIGISIDICRARQTNNNKMRAWFIGGATLLSLEGTREELSFARAETVIINRIIAQTPNEFKRSLSRGPHFNKIDPPIILSTLFPKPLPAQSTGNLQPGTEWTIPFDHGEKQPRSLTVKIISLSDNSLTIVPVRDETEYGKWLHWKKITWRWEQVDEQNTAVTAHFEFERRLDPAFYFRPIERWGVAQAGELFLDALLAS